MKSSFRGKISGNASTRKSGSSFSYLKLPKGVTTFVPEIGKKYVLDFLPYIVTNKKHMDRNDRKEIAMPGEQWYKLPFLVHGSLGAEKKKHKEVCPTTFGKKCPVCEHHAKEKRNGAEDADIKHLKPSLRHLYLVRVLKINGKPVPEPKIQIFDISDFVFQEKMEEQLQHEDGFEYFPDLAEGKSVKIIFIEDNFGGNKYPAPSRFDFEERTKQYGEKFIKNIPSLDECLNILSYEELKALFEEDGGHEDEDDDEKPKSKKKVASHDDEDDEDDDNEDYGETDDDDADEDDDEEDEEPAPRKKKSTQKSAKRYEEEDEDEDEDEDDADEDDADEDDADEEEEEEPRKKPVTGKTASPASGKCPYGHKFGRDNNKFDDCDDCELFKKCKAAK